jgi:predicted dienelactone hydrolase
VFRRTFATVVIAASIACDAPQIVTPPASRPAGRTSRLFFDAERPRWTGSGARPIATTVWYPAVESTKPEDWYLGPPQEPLFRLGASVEGALPFRGADKHPLVLLSHGTGGSAEMLAWLAEPLAAAGYVVAAVNHHGNTAAEQEPSAAGFMLWWERAIDLTRLIDHLVRDDEFGSMIDFGKIGAAGFSLGGYTVLVSAGAITSLSLWEEFCRSPRRDGTCVAQPEFPAMFDEFAKIKNHPLVMASLARHSNSFRDSRIRAVVAISPVGSVLTEDGLRRVTVPVRLVVGSADTTTPAATNAARLAAVIPKAELVTLPNVSHYTFLAECTPAGQKAQHLLCADSPGLDRAAVHRSVAADARTFFDKTLQ